MRWYASISSAVTSSEMLELYLRFRSLVSASVARRRCSAIEALTLASSSAPSCNSSPSPYMARGGADDDVPSPAS